MVQLPHLEKEVPKTGMSVRLSSLVVELSKFSWRTYSLWKHRPLSDGLWSEARSQGGEGGSGEGQAGGGGTCCWIFRSSPDFPQLSHLCQEEHPGPRDHSARPWIMGPDPRCSFHEPSLHRSIFISTLTIIDQFVCVARIISVFF